MTDEPLLKRLADELEALTGFLEAHHFDIQPIVELVTEARAAIAALQSRVSPQAGMREALVEIGRICHSHEELDGVTIREIADVALASTPAEPDAEGGEA